MSKKLNIPKLRFKEFCEEWEEKKIEDIFDFKNGINKEKEFFGQGYPIINFKDVYIQSGIVKESIHGLIETSAKEQKNYSTQKGDVFFTRTSETIMDIGMSAVLLEDIEKCIFSGFVLRARPRKEVLFPEFNKYCFSIFPVRKEIVIKSSFTTRALTSGTLLNKVVFKYPKTQLEQQKIAYFLTLSDQKIEKLKEQLAHLNDYKQGVIQKIFNQDIRFKKDDGSEFGNWQEKELNEFLIPTLRAVSKPKEKYLSIGLRSHGKGTFQKPNFDPNQVAMETLYQVKENDLIVNITFAWEGAITIVKKDDEGGLVSHRFPTYTFNEKVAIYQFFKYVITQRRFIYMLGVISPGGAGRNRVMSKKDFVKLKWTIPSVEEQQKIANFLEKIDQRREAVTRELNESEKYKKSLLQQMFI